MQLTELQALNLDKLKEHLSIVAAGHPMRAIGDVMQSLVQGFEARAVFHLLLDLDRAAFFKNLQRSAQARRFFLRKSREQASDDLTFTALSRTDAVFAAVAGGAPALATEIADLSPGDWQRDGEYEETYSYHRFVHAQVAAMLERGPVEDRGPWLARFGAIVEAIPRSPIDHARLDLCRAFHAGDAGAFWAAFEAMVDVSAEAAAAASLPDDRVFDAPWLAASDHLSIELVAWIVLARGAGFEPPQPDYRRCPSAAWLDGPVEPARDLLLDLEAQFRI